MRLKINSERWKKPESFVATGIYIRALTPEGEWDNADIIQLERDFIIMWAKGRKNGALNALLILLGYEDQQVVD